MKSGKETSMFKFFSTPRINILSMLAIAMTGSIGIAHTYNGVFHGPIPRWANVEVDGEQFYWIKIENFCQSGKQIKELKESFSIALPEVPKGVPKDAALEGRKDQTATIRKIAANWFQNGVHPRDLILNDYTLFIPPECEEKSSEKQSSCRVWKLAFSSTHGDCYRKKIHQKSRSTCSANDESIDFKLKPAPSRAIEHRAELWAEYFRAYTTVKESPSDDGSSFHFEVSLDLNAACKYARPISDLVTP